MLVMNATRAILKKVLSSWQVEMALRQIEVEAKALAKDLIPLPIFELLKLKSLDPFVPRASTFSHRTSGKHFLVLAESPMGFVGGQRSANIALQLLDRSHRVTYVHRIQNTRSLPFHNQLAHASLTHLSFANFSCRSFALEREAREKIVVLCELPLPEYRSCARFLQERGAHTVYDCVENWPRIAPYWYSARTEDKLLEESNIVLASSLILGDALQSRSRRPVHVLPNAVDTRLFTRYRQYSRPPEFPEDKKIFLYVGTLHNESLNWSFLVSLARARPDAMVVAGGICDHSLVDPPPNLLFLGLRPHSEIPSLVAHANVCLLPFLTNRLRWEFCPLRIYEHVAMGKPVVASDTPHLRGFPNVFLAKNTAEFIKNVQIAESCVVDEKEVRSFAYRNSWKERMRQLEHLLEIEKGAQPYTSQRRQNL